LLAWTQVRTGAHCSVAIAAQILECRNVAKLKRCSAKCDWRRAVGLANAF